MSAAGDSFGQEPGSAVSLPYLRGSILASASRSFYLSIRLLPKKLRDPVSLGYLLARASDTIADTTELPIELRTEKSRLLARGIQGEALCDAIVDLISSPAARENFGPGFAFATCESLPREVKTRCSRWRSVTAWACN